MPVAKTDPVSRKVQKVMANHTVKLVTFATRLLPRTWWKVLMGRQRAVPSRDGKPCGAETN